MPSPFPGMDPWLESPRVFADLRFSLVVRLSEALNAVLPSPYYAGCEFRVWHAPRPIERTVPDVLTPPPDGRGPVALPLDGTMWDERRESFVEIRQARGSHDAVCTRIDVPSRENKTADHPSRFLYLTRQRQDLWEGANRVEIDLLRGGEPTTLAPAGLLARSRADAPYHVAVFRLSDPNQVTVYPFGLPDPLPTVRVPFGEDGSEVALDLAAVLNDCYRAAAYDRWGLYRRPCDPPLAPDQQAWAEGVLRAGGLRA